MGNEAVAEEGGRDIRQEIRDRVMAGIDLSRDFSDEEVLDMIREEIIEAGHREPIGLAERMRIERDIFHSLRKLDVLQDLLEEEDITEILINGSQNVFVEKNGRLIKSEKHFSSEEKLLDVIQQIVAATNKIVNESSPIVDTRLSDGSRVNIILPPIAVDYGIVTIRRFPKDPITMKKLIALGSITQEMVDFLEKLVKAGYNMFVSGGTGSGKTTFLNALTEFIPAGERVITIEDAAELQVRGVENLVRLEARSRNLEGNLEVSIRELVRASLRMRPDRIIVGECRGGEALEVLQACNTGHDGSLSTGHANTCADMVSRLETMVLMSGMDIPIPAIRAQIASAVDIFVHLGRLSDRSRKVLEITEVLGLKDGEVELCPLYVYEPGDGNEGRGCWKKVNTLKNHRKLQMAGIAL